MDVLSSRMILRPADHERSVRFYRDTIGLAVHREFPGGTVFFLGQGLLEVSGSGVAGPSPDQMLWMQVRDVVEEVRRLREGGVEVLAEPEHQPWGLIEGTVADPDGMRIVLVEVPSDHPLRADVRRH